jgi:hypothetical protein
MSKAKPFVTTDLPITIKGVDCYLNIVMEKSAYLWNFAFAPEDEDIEIDYSDILSILPQIKQLTGLDMEVVVERKRVRRKEFYNAYYVRVNGKDLDIGSEEDYTAEQVQASIISTLASLIYHHEIFGLVKPEGKDDKHE